MANVNTSQLSGQALDWAAAVIEQFPVKFDPMGFHDNAPESEQAGYWIWDDSPNGRMEIIGSSNGYSPSSCWAHGGRIIEREGISLVPPNTDDLRWGAVIAGGNVYHGETPLIAAIRAYVGNIKGSQIDIPEHLINKRKK